MRFGQVGIVAYLWVTGAFSEGHRIRRSQRPKAHLAVMKGE